MALKILFDTSAFVALINAKDANYEPAKSYLGKLAASDRCCLSRDVFDETATRLRSYQDHRTASTFIGSALDKSAFDLIPIDDDVFQEAIRIFRRYDDKNLSFTDCTTFALYRRRRFDAIFTFDSDFSAIGARVVPDARLSRH